VIVSAQSPNCQLAVTGGYECFDRFHFKPGDLQAAYHNIGDVEVYDFEKWTVSRLRLQSVDTANHIAILSGPALQDSNTGFLPGHRYLLENVQEALSQPGEWYLDRATTPMTLTYLAAPGEDMAQATVVAPQIAQVLVASDLQYVTFRGLSFAHDNWVVPAGGHPSAQGEPRVSAAVSFSRPSFVTVDSCVIAHTGGYGLEMVGAGAQQGSPTDQIVNNELYDLGAGGIRVGQLEQPSDTEANVAQGILVANNIVAGGGRVLPASMGIFLGDTHDNTVTHNDVFDFYQTGIEVCVPQPATCPFPHDNTISFNHVSRIGQGVTSDFAGIYLATYSNPGNLVTNNRIHDVTHAIGDSDGYGGHGVYLDNMTSNVTVQNNLIYRTSQSNYMNDAGISNNFSNNLLAYAYLGTISRGPALIDGVSFRFTNNVVAFLQAIQHPIDWECGTTAQQAVPCPQRFFFDSNLYWSTAGAAPSFITSMLGQPAKFTTYTMAQWQALGEDVHSLNQDPRFQNPTYPADDFRLQPGSPAVTLGFQPFDPTLAGRSAPRLYPPALPPAFPPQALDPVKDYGQPATAGQLALAVVSNATYGAVAAGSIVTAFGANLSTGALQAPSAALPASLLGTTVTVTDSAGALMQAPLYYVSQGQVNFAMPAGMAAGVASVMITSGAGIVSAGGVTTSAVAPGLFSADGSGKGLAAAETTIDGVNYLLTAPGNVAAPMNVSGGKTYLVLFATGLANRSSLAGVSVQVGGVNLAPVYAGAQGVYPGLDQVNVLLPATLKGKGTVSVTVTVDGSVSNAVAIAVQ